MQKLLKYNMIYILQWFQNDFLYILVKPDTRIIRSCGWDDSSYFQNCYQRSGFGGRQEVCTCATDFCNGASISSVAAVLVTSIVFLPRLIV